MNKRKVIITFSETERKIDIDLIARAIANKMTESGYQHGERKEISRITRQIGGGDQKRKER